MKPEDVDLLIEDLDRLVKLANTNQITISSWLSLANSATEIRKILERQKEVEPIWEEPTNEAKDNAEAYCPECDYHFREDYKFCPDCGQKILWK